MWVGKGNIPTMNPPIRLDTNENPYGPSPMAVIAYLKSARCINRYPDYGKYREFLSSRLGLSPENVLPTPGSDRGLQISLQCLSKLYERIVIPSPSFLMYTRFSKLYFQRVERVPSWLGRGWDDILGLSGKDAVLLMGSPNNPTGEVVGENIIRKFLEEFGMVIVDEAYFEYYGKSLVPILGDFENLVLSRTFSKAYGLAGLRCGYLVGSAEIIKGVEAFAGPFDVPAPAVEASKAALQDEGWLRMVVETTSSNRSYMMDGLNQVDGVKAHDSKANYLLLQVEDAQSISEDLASKDIRVRLVTPEWGCIDREFLRVTVGTLREVNYFLCALRRALAS